MKKFEEIAIPPLEAESFFNDSSSINSVFYKTDNYEKILKPTTYFILGDKGSGKTMLSAYFCSKYSEELVGKHFMVSVDDYNKFVQMKKNNELKFTDYTTIWKVILIIKILLSIDKNEIDSIIKTPIFNKLKNIANIFNLAETTKDTFSPSTIIDNKELVESLSYGVTNGISSTTFDISSNTNSSFSEKTGRTIEYKQLRYIDRWTSFINDTSEQLIHLRLKKPHYLFVDGIDIRPNSIDYSEYKECVSSLVRAVYDINHSIFSKMRHRDTGRLQIVVLSRLDIFLESDLNNAGCKIVDNSVYLNWALSNLNNIKQTDIYKLINNVLSEGKTGIDMWQKYMNFEIKRGNYNKYDSFAYCMRLTAARPRDFIRILQLLQEDVKSNKNNSLEKIFYKDGFQKKYSTYYVQSIQSEMSFYYSKDEYDLFFSFIRTFNGLQFLFKEFEIKLDNFFQKEKLKRVFGSELEILNLMYNLNIICLIEENNIYRWKYRETTIDNYSPSLYEYKIDKNTKFIFHWAVEKTLSIYTKPKNTYRNYY